MSTTHERDATGAPFALDDDVNHETNEPLRPKRTSLPKFQLFIVFLIQFSEPITATVIYPFVNQFVRDTGVTRGDERKTGYYAGIIESVFFLAEALTVFHWGWASDRFGRRPILLLGPIGLSIAMLSFGLSKSFWPLVVSRCLQGVFNGNIGVSKSVIAEITDSTNIADVFAMMPLIWSCGTTLGPIIGGMLSQPARSWPAIFGRVVFFHNYPYFLPCAVAALLALASGLIASIGLKETLPAAVLREKKRKAKAAAQFTDANPSSMTSLLGGENGTTYGSNGFVEALENDYTPEVGVPHSSEPDVDPSHAPPPFRALLVPKVLIPLMVYAFLTFVDMSTQVLLPLIYSTSISMGGLGFDPYRIGLIMGTWGVINAVVQLCFLGKLIRKFGPRKIQIIAQSSYVVVLSTYPLLNFFARRAGTVDVKVWAVIIIQLTFAMTNYPAFASIHIIILDSAPTRASLGATNGMAQAVGSIMRSIAPSAASSLFSVSLERHLAGGNMVFIILAAIGLVGLRSTFLLPKHSRSLNH
ncbi:Protein ZINC INDUCED FACILITATOR-LIKE 1 [Hypsizygus marmoreus]|uniref:Protein ZINC INDUCED FACILITATOR-LIKE 1 n=1 Tax=Hypsizygus marmoreus TaxID=39966 RepID=A0A369JX36_HYPMA|nr:Protein ZINC INDUCED FACILITATOR-LIKE 1 [Hypsizygus marmoreus]